MEYFVIGAVALVASALTLFSGFGLGTLLLPAFAFFFPLPTAVAMTAVVHLLNNLFKLGLVGLKADRTLVLRFGIPALVAAAAGAFLLTFLTDLPALFEYTLWGGIRTVTPVGLAVAVLMIVFSLIELHPRFQKASIPPKWLSVGGALSGFIGGVSGHQGALRSAFLLRFKESITKESFIATNVVIAVFVDVVRLAVYGAMLTWTDVLDNPSVMSTAVLCAFAGAWIGARLMKKVTLATVQRIVAAMLVLLALGIGSGLVGEL